MQCKAKLPGEVSTDKPQQLSTPVCLQLPARCWNTYSQFCGDLWGHLHSGPILCEWLKPAHTHCLLPGLPKVSVEANGHGGMSKCIQYTESSQIEPILDGISGQTGGAFRFGTGFQGVWGVVEGVPNIGAISSCYVWATSESARGRLQFGYCLLWQDIHISGSPRTAFHHSC